MFCSVADVIRGAESDAGMGALMLASATSEADLAVLLENGVTHILQVRSHTRQGRAC